MPAMVLWWLWCCVTKCGISFFSISFFLALLFLPPLFSMSLLSKECVYARSFLLSMWCSFIYIFPVTMTALTTLFVDVIFCTERYALSVLLDPPTNTFTWRRCRSFVRIVKLKAHIRSGVAGVYEERTKRRKTQPTHMNLDWGNLSGISSDSKLRAHEFEGISDKHSR